MSSRDRRPPTARGLAIEAMVAVDQGGRANLVVPNLLDRTRLEPRDRHLVTELVYGTCRMQRACDWLISRHTKGRLDRDVRAALRIGAYQIGWTRIPPHAAVSATVEEIAGPGRSLVNAVLRRVADDVTKGLVTWPDRATELSYPDWMVDALTSDLGRSDALAALAQMNEPATVNRREDGYVQDRGSQMISEHLGTLIGRDRSDRPPYVLDLCAAPGGKATGMAAAGAGPFVVAADVAPERAGRIAENVLRTAASSVSVMVADGQQPALRPESFDLVLVDAPCSGLGVLRRRPDARWRIQPQDVDRLAAFQRRLLTAACPLVRPGGILAYSVCTLTGAETASIDRWLARTGPELVPLPPPGGPWRHAGRGALLLPQAEGTDGMFLLMLRRH